MSGTCNTSGPVLRSSQPTVYSVSWLPVLSKVWDFDGEARVGIV
jgi:hypothetical protein